MESNLSLTLTILCLCWNISLEHYAHIVCIVCVYIKKVFGFCGVTLGHFHVFQMLGLESVEVELLYISLREKLTGCSSLYKKKVLFIFVN